MFVNLCPCCGRQIRRDYTHCHTCGRHVRQKRQREEEKLAFSPPPPPAPVAVGGGWWRVPCATPDCGAMLLLPFRPTRPKRCEAHAHALDGQEWARRELRRRFKLVTCLENSQHSWANGRKRPWYKATVWHGKPRITEEQKAAIRQLRASGMMLKDIGRRFNLGTSHVHRIAEGKL
jgi:hypothetical protein